MSFCTSDAYDFGNRLIKLMARAKLSCADVARKMGVTSNCVSQWRCGNAQPRTLTIPALCRTLRCTADELLGVAPPMRAVDMTCVVDPSLPPGTMAVREGRPALLPR